MRLKEGRRRDSCGGKGGKKNDKNRKLGVRGLESRKIETSG